MVQLVIDGKYLQIPHQHQRTDQYRITQHIPRARPNLHRQSIYGQSQEQHDRGHTQQPVYIHHIHLLTHSCTLPVTNNTQIVLPIVAVKIENQSFAITSK